VDRLFEGGVYSFHILTPAYYLVGFICLVDLLYLVFTRGHPVIRLALLCGTVCGAISFFGQGTGFAVNDPEVALIFFKIGIAPVSVTGPVCLVLALAVGNQLDRHQVLAAVAVAISVASAILALTTDLILTTPWWTPLGIWYPTAGPLNLVHLGNVLGWAGIGWVVSRKGLRQDAVNFRRLGYRRTAVILVLLPFAAIDVLLAHGIVVVPLSWLASGVLLLYFSHALMRGDLMRRRGRDWGAAGELAVFLGVATALWAIAETSLPDEPRFAALAWIFAVAAMTLGQVAIYVVRRPTAPGKSRAQGTLERALDEYEHMCTDVVPAIDLAARAVSFLGKHLHLTEPRMYLVRDSQLIPLRASPSSAAQADIDLAPELLEALEDEREPVIGDRVHDLVRNARGQLVACFMQQQRAEVLLPLLDRDRLIGVMMTGERSSEHAVTDHEAAALRRLAQATARALTYATVYREHAKRLEAARELELATVLQQRRRAGVEQLTVGGCQASACYEPAGQFGGDWWMARELPDGCLAVGIGRTAGPRLPAALITATIDGGYETAIDLAGDQFSPLEFLLQMNDLVREVGHSRYLTSCFAAVYDPRTSTLDYANAGQSIPYLCRRTGDDLGKTELVALTSEGIALGAAERPPLEVSRRSLGKGDAIVLFTEALIGSENNDGVRYGDQRLRQALVNSYPDKGADLCSALVADVRSHHGGVAAREDLTVVCVHVGAALPATSPAS
jgi:serine phosphatase RsbU (regulator of sigma subunit)